MLAVHRKTYLQQEVTVIFNLTMKYKTKTINAQNLMILGRAVLELYLPTEMMGKPSLSE